MTQEPKSYWFGPTALFVGLTITFFGGLFFHFVSLSSDLLWLNYARNIVLLVGLLLIVAGVRRILGEGGNK